jgi:hypothetical protein
MFTLDKKHVLCYISYWLQSTFAFHHKTFMHMFSRKSANSCYHTTFSELLSTHKDMLQPMNKSTHFT